MPNTINYKDKHEWSEKMHNKIAHYYLENYKCYEKITCPIIQKTMDIDLLVVDFNNKGYFVEEKFIDHPPYKNIAIEVIQNTKYGNNNPGWIEVSRADILAWHHCLEDHTQSYFIDLPALQRFYKKNNNKYRHIVTRTGVCANTHPRHCLIPWSDIEDYIGYKMVEIAYKEEEI